jgi:cytochrome c
MSRFLEFGAPAAAAVVAVLAYNFGDRFVTPMPELPDRSEAIAKYTAPPPSPLMAAVAEGHAEGRYGLGRPATPDEIAAWDVNVMPDGRGLPPGSGSVEDGEVLFAENCAVCHGDFAEGVDRWPPLAGGIGTLTEERPHKTVGSYWPYLSTAWDYVHRSMPFGAAQTLSPDEVYAIVAYILYSNDLVDSDFVLSDENFLDVEMPNANGFIVDDRPETEYPLFRREPCMSGCKDGPVEVTMRAVVLDVTPEQAEARQARETQAATGDEAGAVEAPAAAEETALQEAAVEAPSGAQPETGGVVIDPALAAAGEKVFRKCQSCHQVGEGAKNRSGPHLNGIVGRPVAAAEGFRYSAEMKAMGEAGEVWTPERLARFLADPKGDVKGTKMSFRGLNKPEDIAAVIAYLAQFQ